MKSAKKIKADCLRAGLMAISCIAKGSFYVFHAGTAIFMIKKDGDKRGAYYVDVSAKFSNKFKARNFADGYGYPVKGA